MSAPSATETSNSLSELFTGSPEEARACLDWLSALDDDVRVLARAIEAASHAGELRTKEARQIVCANLYYQATDYIKLLMCDERHLRHVGPGMRRWLDPAIRELYHSVIGMREGNDLLDAGSQLYAGVLAASKPFEQLFKLLVLFLLQKGRRDLIPQAPTLAERQELQELRSRLAEAAQDRLDALAGEASDRPVCDFGPLQGDDWNALPRLARNLLRYMHGREQADLEEVFPAVWEKEYVAGRADVHGALNAANNFLATRESKRTLHKRRGEIEIYWE
jgi:hypothetical protein